MANKEVGLSLAKFEDERSFVMKSCRSCSSSSLEKSLKSFKEFDTELSECVFSKFEERLTELMRGDLESASEIQLRSHGN